MCLMFNKLNHNDKRQSCSEHYCGKKPQSWGLTRMLLYMLPFSTSRLTLMMQQSSTCWLYSGSDSVE